MPLSVLTNEQQFEEIILERRLNVMIFTVCWSLGSKRIFPAIFHLSSDQTLTHLNFYRIDLDENNLQLTQRLNITSIPTIQWYFHGNRLDQLIGVDLKQFSRITHHLAEIYKRKTTKQASKLMLLPSIEENLDEK